MATLPLRIESPKGLLFDGEVLSVTVPTDKGPLMIEPGYTNLIATLSDCGILKVVKKDGVDYFAVFGGVIDVSKLEGTTVYPPDINRGYEIDLARALAAKERNQERLDRRQEGIDLERAKIKLAKALVRINVKHLSEGGK